MLFVFVLPALVLMALLAYTRLQTATILLVALIPAYLVRFSVAGIPTNVFEASVFVVFLFSYLQRPIRQQWRLALRQMSRWLILFVILFVLSAIVSTVVSPHLKTSLGILKGWIFTPIIIGWLVYVFGLVDIKNNYHGQILRSLVLSGVVVSFLGLTQIGQLDRVRSVYDVSNSLALFIVPLIVIAFYLTVTGYRKAYLLAVIIMTSALIATQSAAGIIAVTLSMLVGVVIHYFSNRKKKVMFFGIAFVVLLVLVFLLVITATGRLNYLVRPWISQGYRNSISVRMQLWDIGFFLVKQHSLLGVGLGTFEPAYQGVLHVRFSRFNNCEVLGGDCVLPIAEFVYRDPHNWPLSFWLNLGFVGLFSFTCLNIFVAWKAATRLRLKSRNESSVLVIATMLALISMLIFGLVDTIYWKNDLSALYWILIALLMVGF